MNQLTQDVLSILRSPLSKAPLKRTTEQLQTDLNESFPIIENVPILLSESIKKYIDLFDAKYTSHAEPWDYSRKAVEQVRFVYVTQVAKELIGDGQRILDIGCSLGQLTHQLNGIGREVWAMDISPIAAVKTRKFLNERGGGEGFKVFAASATELPFADNSFRVVLLSDGLHGWELSDELQFDVLREVHRVLEPGGYAVLTDYLSPRNFLQYQEKLKNGPLEFVRVEYLGDRVGFQIANNFKSLQNVWPFKSVLGSLKFNLALCKLSKPFGPNFSKHMAVILRKRS